jgi:hypothetical protein
LVLRHVPSSASDFSIILLGHDFFGSVVVQPGSCSTVRAADSLFCQSAPLAFWVPIACQGMSTPLSCTMTLLIYSMDATFECGPVDVNVGTFAEAALIIGGRDTVEEFLASGLWPLSEKFGLEVETKETTLLKVVVPVTPRVMVSPNYFH